MKLLASKPSIPSNNFRRVRNRARDTYLHNSIEQSRKSISRSTIRIATKSALDYDLRLWVGSLHNMLVLFLYNYVPVFGKFMSNMICEALYYTLVMW